MTGYTNLLASFRWLIAPRALILLMMLFWFPGLVHSYNFVILDFEGGTSTATVDVNDSGMAVGFYRSDLDHGLILDGGGLNHWDYPGFQTSMLWGMNDSGAIVGQVYDGDFHGFLYTASGSEQLDATGAYYTYARGVNNSGHVVGYTYNGFGTARRGFFYDGNSYTYLDAPNAADTYAYDINDSGAIVGHYVDNSRYYHGFIFDGSNFYQIDPPDTTGGNYARGINNAGIIVGTYSGGSFIYAAGTYYPINVPGATNTVAEGINNWGQIAGYYQDGDNVTRGFIAYPEEDDPTWVDGQAVDSDFDGIPDSIDDTPNTANPNICPDDHSVLEGTFVAGTQASCRSALTVDVLGNVLVEGDAILAVSSPSIYIDAGFVAAHNAWVRMHCCSETHPPTRPLPPPP